MKLAHTIAAALAATALLATPVLADGHKGKADKAMEKGENGMKGKETPWNAVKARRRASTSRWTAARR